MADIKLVCLSCAQTNRLSADRAVPGAKCGTCGAPLLSAKPQEIDPSTLSKAVANDGLPLLVDFWAPWCGPCRMMAPEFAKAASMLQGKARLVKLDTQTHPEASQRYAIRGIPALILFEKGREIRRHAGAIPAAQITGFATGVSV